MSLGPCPTCAAALRTPLVCESCGRLLRPSAPPSPFAALGLEPAQALDVAAARKRLLALSRVLHPDFHGSADAATRRLAEENTAQLNAAFQVVADELRRADWLVRHLGGPGEDEERGIPGEFLAEVLEWNETIEDARTAGAAGRSSLEVLERRLREERAATLRDISALLTPLPARGSPALHETRRLLNAARYLDRAIGEIDELRLSRRT